MVAAGSIALKVQSIRAETYDTYTFVLLPVEPTTIHYNAGQFLTIIIGVHGRVYRRSYSFNSTPGVDEFMSITIKRVANGTVSRYIIDHIKEGDVLQALLPAGRFVAEDPDATTYCFIAAGSGIIPIYALIKQLLFPADHIRILLLYQNTHEEAVIFKAELQQLQSKFSHRFTLLIFYSQPISPRHSPVRLTNTYLEKLLTSYLKAAAPLFYVCGPKAFMLMVHFTLKVMGYTSSQIKQEAFQIDLAPPPALPIATIPRECEIIIGNHHHNIIVTYPESILQAALNQGVHLPYSCLGGRCSTCTVKLIEGEVQMSMNEVLTDKDLHAGLVLTCVGFALSDVKIMV